MSVRRLTEENAAASAQTQTTRKRSGRTGENGPNQDIPGKKPVTQGSSRCRIPAALSCLESAVPFRPPQETVVTVVRAQAGSSAATEFSRRIETCCDNDAADESSIKKALADCLELSDYIAELTK